MKQILMKKYCNCFHNIDFIESNNYIMENRLIILVNTEMSLIEWMNDDTEYSIEDLNILKKIGISKWRAIQSIINKNKIL